MVDENHKDVIQREISAKLKVLSTALHQDSAFFFPTSSFKTGLKVVEVLAHSPEAKISSSLKTPIANPSAKAALRAVVSMSAGLMTGLPNKSAYKS